MKTTTSFYILAIIFIKNFYLSECIDCSVQPKTTEIRLRQKLLCSYDRDSRPIIDTKNGTTVTIRMFLKSFDYNDYTRKVELNSWLGMLWIDNRLKWDPAEYDSIETLTIHSDEIWMPDLAIFNSKTTQFEESCSPSHCALYSTGSISCIPPCSHSGQCQGVYTDWPFDLQNCTLHFGSWMHKGSEITYKASKLQVDRDALTNLDWKLVYIDYKNIPGNYSCCPNETYPSIRVNILVERHSAAEITYIVTPAIILCALNLITLWLSPICSERIFLNALSLLSHFLFQQMQSWMVPKNGDTAPKALTFFRDSMIISTVLLLQTLILRSLFYRKSSSPTWMKSITESLGGNRVGQLMFTNPYLINKGTTLNNEDSTNLVEEQATDTVQQKPEETNNGWVTIVRIFDSLMFIALVISYIILLIGWLPSSYRKFPNGIKGDIIDVDE